MKNIKRDKIEEKERLGSYQMHLSEFFVDLGNSGLRI
jgi:hypothetical protein